jgi:hypothetical protein
LGLQKLKKLCTVKVPSSGFACDEALNSCESQYILKASKNFSFVIYSALIFYQFPARQTMPSLCRKPQGR